MNGASPSLEALRGPNSEAALLPHDRDRAPASDGALRQAIEYHVRPDIRPECPLLALNGRRW